MLYSDYTYHFHDLYEALRVLFCTQFSRKLGLRGENGKWEKTKSEGILVSMHFG